MHCEKSCIAENHALRKNHASRKSCIAKIMHCRKSCIAEIMHCRKTCFTKIMHRENHALRKSCIAENHASWKIRHCEKSCIAKIMHREFEIYTSREDFIPRLSLCTTKRFYASSNLYIARRIFTSLELMHHEKNPCLVENHASQM